MCLFDFICGFISTVELNFFTNNTFVPYCNHTLRFVGYSCLPHNVSYLKDLGSHSGYVEIFIRAKLKLSMQNNFI